MSQSCYGRRSKTRMVWFVFATVCRMVKQADEPSTRRTATNSQSITQRTTKSGDTRYDARVRGSDGVQRYRTFTVKADAQRWQREQRAAKDRGDWLDPSIGRQTLAEWSEEWLQSERQLRESSLRIHSDNMRLHILPVLGTVPLAQLTDTMLEQWFASIIAKPSRGHTRRAGSANQIFRTLNRCLNIAVRRKRIPFNPLADVQRMRPDDDHDTELTIISPLQLHDLADRLDDRYRMLPLLAGWTGLRAAELVGLRRHRVNLATRRIQVFSQLAEANDGNGFVESSPKTKAGRRTVPIPEPIAKRLAEHMLAFSEPGREGLVFITAAGTPIRWRNWSSRHWRPAVRDAGLGALRFHDLRHGAVSMAIESGADLKVVQRIAGHSSAVMTLDRYGHLMPDALDDFAARMDAKANEAMRLHERGK
jgi:integrase